MTVQAKHQPRPTTRSAGGPLPYFRRHLIPAGREPINYSFPGGAARPPLPAKDCQWQRPLGCGAFPLPPLLLLLSRPGNDLQGLHMQRERDARV